MNKELWIPVIVYVLSCIIAVVAAVPIVYTRKTTEDPFEKPPMVIQEKFSMKNKDVGWYNRMAVHMPSNRILLQSRNKSQTTYNLLLDSAPTVHMTSKASYFIDRNTMDMIGVLTEAVIMEEDQMYIEPLARLTKTKLTILKPDVFYFFRELHFQHSPDCSKLPNLLMRHLLNMGVDLTRFEKRVIFLFGNTTVLKNPPPYMMCLNVDTLDPVIVVWALISASHVFVDPISVPHGYMNFVKVDWNSICEKSRLVQLSRRAFVHDDPYSKHMTGLKAFRPIFISSTELSTVPELYQ